jgi:hypothetical protein
VHAGGGCSRVVLSVFSSYRFHFYREVDRLNSLSLPGRIGLSWLSAFSLLLGMCVDSGAQALHAGGQELLHGSIFSAQGQPAAEAAVELRDLRGVKVASAVTDGSGNFQINSAAAPGEYVFLATSGYQIRYEQVLLAQPGLELSLALPAAAVSRVPRRAGTWFRQNSWGFPQRRANASSLPRNRSGD